MCFEHNRQFATSHVGRICCILFYRVLPLGGAKADGSKVSTVAHVFSMKRSKQPLEHFMRAISVPSEALQAIVHLIARCHLVDLAAHPSAGEVHDHVQARLCSLHTVDLALCSHFMKGHLSISWAVAIDATLF